MAALHLGLRLGKMESHVRFDVCHAEACRGPVARKAWIWRTRVDLAARRSRKEDRREVPQPLGIRWIDRVGRDAAAEVFRPLGENGSLVAVLEISPPDALELRRGHQQYRGRGPLLAILLLLRRGDQLAADMPLQVGEDGAGIERVAENPGLGPATRRLHGK